MKKTFFIVLTVLLLWSCEPSNIDLYQDYVGVWVNETGNVTRTLEIDAIGFSSYEERTDKGNTSTTLSFKGIFVLEGSTLKIGFKTLTINQVPTKVDGAWYLIMNDLEYQRKRKNVW